MAPATRVQIFDIAAPHFAFAKTKRPFQIIDLERLGVDLCGGFSAAVVTERGPLLCPNRRHRVEQFCHAHERWVSVQDRFDDVWRQ